MKRKILSRNTSKKIISIGLILLLTLLTLAGCGRQEDPTGEQAQKVRPLPQVKVILDWTPNTNHTGLYVALDKGYYREQGLDVEILQAGEVAPDQMVAAGTADFGVSFQENVTYARAAEIPLVSIAAIIQHNTSGLASLKEANITRPRDLEGKRYAYWGSEAEKAVIDAIVTKDGGNPETIKYIDTGYVDFLTVLGKEVDFYWIYQGWEGIRAELEGVPLNVIMLNEVEPAFDYYTPVLITSEKMIAEKPDLVWKFLAATGKGYQDCINDPEGSAEILLKAAPELDRELVIASQKWLKDQYKADAPYWGWQDGKVWANYAAWMLEKKLLQKEVDTNKAFTNRFLPGQG
ncbi:MAG TPA: ABC transporter substrate-binding protein [Peptococcaceae bacterium]|nr:ABC transporter substrate-binding protein [Peptococcaceae bacterium]HPZ70813.1 ABC transporter substrate-binding protein [Peptococcaceae bacterium]HQD53527.1 ABC transporter substrate-binding protein [Peptococcaceae bacterium]